MAFSDKKKMTEYVNNRNKEKYDRIGLMVPKGQKDVIQAAAAARGESVNAYLNRIVAEAITRDAPESVSNAAEASTEAAEAPTESPTERDSAPGVDVPGTPGNAAESG